ncbi:hypothetical protein SAMN05444159_6194 [Bradyrhizobium lablabi]|uniref:Chemotaxis protein CheZ n=1 Tax=Bradyrhizobium lablabi TaxID=722472 RepID=A0A1M7BKU8_9BRAD|nr:hypothetical protein [Bradyrhizobium lablabi]SHL55591.1 hypothetical protein SAMN05444159_6194 [Bradyrhizobium lablabi]
MADEAFALSPISARAAQPSEQDYEAISEAFMETSRGRWFLGEYAKRNRNADTRMVLDAVERIEQSLAAQKQPAADRALTEALAAIKSALDEARGMALAALDGLALEEHLAPVRKGARVIKEIAWRWREIGADARICDLIDSQVHAIEGACGQLSSTEAKGALSAAFDLIERRIAGFDDSDAAPRAAEEAAASAAAAPAPSATAAPETMPPATAASDPEAAIGTTEIPTEETVAQAPAAEMVAEAADVQPDVSEITEEAAEADDEAVLELVAQEMAALDDSDIELDSGPDPDETDAAPWPVEPVIVAREAEPQEAEPMASPTQAEAMQAPLQPSLENAVAERAVAERPLESSLGSSLIASGIVTKPAASASDPLAPLRRMSQAEKIALFS